MMSLSTPGASNLRLLEVLLTQVISSTVKLADDVFCGRVFGPYPPK